ncbi:4290_t:CDS:2, partial [Funneliformis mosseae]
EISAIDESDSVIDQQNNVNTKSMEEVHVSEVIAEQSVSDKSVKFIRDARSKAVQSEWFDSHFIDRREKNLDSELLIADISGINSQDSVISLNEKDRQDIYLASPSSESCIASPSFENSKEGKVPYKQKVKKGLVCELLEFIRSYESLPNFTTFSKQIPVDFDLASECQKVISRKSFSRSHDLLAELNKSELKKSPDVRNKSITWCRDAFEYIDPEAKCPACKSVHMHRCIWGDWTCQDKNNFYYLMCPWDIYENKKVKIAIQD